MNFRGRIPGPAKTGDRAYGTDFFMLTPWDKSFHPRTNDRIAKLGVGGGTRGVAISDFDHQSNRQMTAADPISSAFASRARIEPDNWVFLDHGGIDKVWASRDSVDHENSATSIKHRSDIVTNQKRKMCWAYKQDLEWIVEIEDVGPPIPEGRNFDGAGFIGAQSSGPHADASAVPAIGIGSLNSLMAIAAKLKVGGPLGMIPVKLTGITKQAKDAQRQDVATESNAKAMRATRAFNFGQRGGFMTDGLRITQFHHFGFAMPRPKPPPKPRFEPVETPSNQGGSYRPGGGQTGSPYVPGGGSYNPNDPQNKARDTGLKIPPETEHKPGTITFDQAGGPDSDCMVEPWVGAFRPDAWWDVEGRAAQLAFSDERPPRAQDLYEGVFILATPSPRHPKYRPAEDRSSDQPILEHPDAPWGLRPAVWLPRETGVPPSCQLNSDISHSDGSYSTTGHAPPASTGGGADAGEWSQPVPTNDNGMTKFEFTAGYLTYVKERIPMPMSSPEARLEILVPYTIPVNLAGGTQMDFRLFWKPSLAPGQDFPTEWTEMTKSITAGDNPTGPQQLRWLRFEIPRLGLAYLGGAGGGQIDVWFMRRSDDTATGKAFLLAGAIRFSRAPIASAKRVPFAGVI